MALFPRITEQRIQEAMDDGAFDNLPGEGRPLPRTWDGEGLDAITAFGNRLMKEAGVLPEEVQLRRDLAAARAARDAASDPDEKARLDARILELGLRHAVAKETRLRRRF
ncbi:DnaJ family domain-containing protein [Litorisediminicola beolgyonensis]|uniref:DUF1992 domain-containing protein n=1 Tax=Litorisediminicola beolgyonensis TaxID=1173614 RepID=A0ABW3ZEI3_9RHOB